MSHTLLTCAELTSIINEVPKPAFVTDFTKEQRAALIGYTIRVGIESCAAQANKDIETLKSYIFTKE